MSQLIIGIDLQKGYLPDGSAETGYVEHVERFLAAQDKSTVLLTRFVDHPNSNFVRLLQSESMQEGGDDTALFGSLESAGFMIVQKAGYTSWLPEVQARATEIGADEIVMFGLDSDACVLKTALDVFEADLRPIVIRDLCEDSAGHARHVQGIALLNELIGAGQVVDSASMMPARA